MRPLVTVNLDDTLEYQVRQKQHARIRWFQTFQKTSKNCDEQSLVQCIQVAIGKIHIPVFWGWEYVYANSNGGITLILVADILEVYASKT